jgi:hypothetical protein
VRGYAVSLSTWLLVLAATALTTGERLVERIVRGGGTAREDLARLLGRATLLWLLLAAAVALIARTATRAGNGLRGVAPEGAGGRESDRLGSGHSKEPASLGGSHGRVQSLDGLKRRR